MSLRLCPNFGHLEESSSSQQWRLEFGSLHYHPPCFFFPSFVFPFSLSLALLLLLLLFLISFLPSFLLFLLVSSSFSLGCNYALWFFILFRSYLLPPTIASTNKANKARSSSPCLLLLPCYNRNDVGNNKID